MYFLVVDDSPVMRDILIRILKQAGYAEAAFAEAGNGLEALRCMRDAKPDLMFLDWNMPDFNGIELAEKLQLAGIKVKFGFVTIETSEEIRRRALNTGALFVISKPFTPEAMIEAIGQAGLVAI